MKDNKVKKLEKEIEVLKYIIKNILWMSVRYSHSRHTYAPGIIRECVSLLKNLYPNEQFLRPDRTIQPPSPEELKNPMVLRSDWLDDLLEDVNKDLVDEQVDDSVVNMSKEDRKKEE